MNRAIELFCGAVVGGAIGALLSIVAGALPFFVVQP